jgi:CobQ-like glutamine amidotransferase family enzyme
VTTVTIGHLYPGDMNTYGDSGNLVALQRRLQWRSYRVEVVAIQPGSDFNFNRADIVIGGGGQDSGQLRIAGDLAGRGQQLRDAAVDGFPMLLVCGLYQLFGNEFVTDLGQRVDGIGVFAATTRGSVDRLIGNIKISTVFGSVVGFENHSGQTTLLPGQQPLGQVVKGWGNNDHTRSEGAMTHHTIGTYLHGPVLPKNPALTDHLILTALQRRHLTQELAPLDDQREHLAADAAARRPARMPNDKVGHPRRPLSAAVAGLRRADLLRRRPR